jgi:3-isopropylmalate/(R)-2-methylmalate dehydratase small subunit
VISTSFADIFKGNALKNGLLPVVVPPEIHKWLLDNSHAVLRIDLASQTLSLPDGRTVEFPVDNFAKHCMLEGVDELGYILRQADAIEAYESSHPAPINTLQA